MKRMVSIERNKWKKLKFQVKIRNNISLFIYLIESDEKVNADAEDDDDEDENSVTNEEPSELELFSQALGLKRSENHK